MGRPTRRGELLDGNVRSPLLFVAQGNHGVLVRDHNGCIVVFLLVEISAEAKARIASLPPPIQERGLRTLRHQLLSQTRCAFALSPSEPRTILAVDRIAVEQLIRITKDDPGSFNRYADAIQETVNAAVRAFWFLGALVTEGDLGDGRTVKGPPPAGMYA